MSMENEQADLRHNEMTRAARSASRWIFATSLSLVVAGLAGLLMSLEGWSAVDPSLLKVGLDAAHEGGLLAVLICLIGMVALCLLLVVLRLEKIENVEFPSHTRWLCLASFVAFGLSAAAAGCLQSQSMLQSFRAARLEEQLAVARLRAQQVEDWTKERLLSLDFLAMTLKQLKREAGSRQELVRMGEVALAEFLAIDQERIFVGVFRPNGDVVISDGRLPESFQEVVGPDVLKAAYEHKRRIGPIQSGGFRSDGLTVPFITPIARKVDADPKRRVLVSIVDPTVTILRRFQEWPYPSPTSTIGLVIRDGDQWIHVVEDRRVSSEAPLSFRVSVNREAFVPVADDRRAWATWNGTSHDDNKRTLTALYSIDGVPWFVVARTDLSEAMAPANKQVRLIYLLTAVLIVFGGLLMLAIASHIRLLGLAARQ